MKKIKFLAPILAFAMFSCDQYLDVNESPNNVSFDQITPDKLLPGAKEQWKLKISGANKEKIAAELVATLYDASLDAFLPHSFDFALPQSIFNGYLGNYTSNAFGISNSGLYISKNWNL